MEIKKIFKITQLLLTNNLYIFLKKYKNKAKISIKILLFLNKNKKK